MRIGSREEAVLVEVVAEIYPPDVSAVLVVRRILCEIPRLEVVVARTCNPVVLLIVELSTIIGCTIAELLHVFNI